MKTHSLTVIWPGLALVLTQPVNRALIPEVLAKMLRQGRLQRRDTPLMRLLVEQFHHGLVQGPDLPVASLVSSAPHALLMTPCHCRPDRDQLRLFAPCALTEQERMALQTDLSALLDRYGMSIQGHWADHWVLQAANPLEVTFTALEAVSEKGVYAALPAGQAQRQWRCLWNEIQMLLHTHPVNQQRQQRGEPAINSVWFWGAGDGEWASGRWHFVQGNSPLLKALAAITHSESEIHTPTYQLASGRQLWVWDALPTDAMEAQLVASNHLLQPVIRQLKSGKLQALTLMVPHYGTLNIRPLDCWKFWKR